MASHSLTQKAIEALISRARNGDGGQLELIDDREPGIGIAEARNLAQDRKREIALGVDPNEEKREAVVAAAKLAANQRKLRDVLDDYEKRKLSQLRTTMQTRRALDGKRGLLKDFVHRDIGSITRGEIVEAVRAVAQRAPIAANRSLAFAKAFFNWCVDQEFLEASPATTIKKPSKERTRDRYHTLDELMEIWDALGELGYPFGHLYRLLIVVPMRREEIAGIRAGELDLAPNGNPDDAVWTLPSGRTKRGNSLRVPLSPLAQSLIRKALASPERPEDSPFVFSITGETSVSCYAKAKRRLDRIIGERRAKAAKEAGREPVDMEHWTIHDLRTSFSTLACEVLGADISVVDRILNHVATATTSKIMRTYNKSELFEPRKRVLREWAELIERETARRAGPAARPSLTRASLRIVA